MSGYSKLFSTIWTGSMYGRWKAAAVFMVFLSLADKDGVVDMTPEAIAGLTGWPIEIILEGISELESPDTRSRTKTHEGRRILLVNPERDWGWIITNYKLYRDKMRSQDRRDYLAEAQRQHRERMSTSVNNVNNVNQCQPIAEASSEASSEKTKIAPPIADAKKASTEKPTRPRDPLWEAVITACGLDGGTPTDRERSAWNGAVKSLRAAKATPGEVTARAACYRARWPHVSLTPTALARRWTECVAMVGER